MQTINNTVNIRNLQHYLYCPHRWGLIEIGDCWAENYFVVKANLEHERVHAPENSYTNRGKKVLTSVTVWNDNPKYDLYGVTDCIELTEDRNGTKFHDKMYHFCIVEYKSTKPRELDYNFDDALQVYAQKKCVDYVFGCDSEAVIYYSNVKKRVTIPFSSQYYTFESALMETLKSIRHYKNIGEIPLRQKNQKCNGCSFRDMCLPEMKKIDTMKNVIMKTINEYEKIT